MFEARQGKELVVKFRNRVGLLFDISKLISEKGVSILAACGGVWGTEGIIRLVTDDNLRASEVLNANGYSADEENAILMEIAHKPGMLQRVSHSLVSEEIDIRHLYGSALIGQEKCLLVLRTSNDEHALLRLNKL